MGVPNSQIPKQWPDTYATKYNANNTLSVEFNNNFKVDTYISVSRDSLGLFLGSRTNNTFSEFPSSYVNKRSQSRYRCHYQCHSKS